MATLTFTSLLTSKLAATENITLFNLQLVVLFWEHLRTARFICIVIKT